MTILAVDPGLMTGWATLWGDHFTSGQDAFFPFLERAERFMKATPDLTIVVERFVINAGTIRKTQAPWSLEVIGALRYLAEKYGHGELVMQLPAEAKRFVSDLRLDDQGWRVRGQDHANDAARHLYLYLAKTGRLVPQR